MRVARPLAASPRSVGILLVLLALALRFAVPAGYMLAGDGTFTIQPCPSGGVLPGMASVPAEHETMAMTMGPAMPMALGGEERHPGSDLRQVCPFGVLGASVMPAVPPILQPAKLVELGPPVILPQQVPLVRALAAPPPPSRGPPLLS